MNSPRHLTRRSQAVGLSVNQLTLAELHQEMLRRVRVLQEKKTELQRELERIDTELAAIREIGGGPSSADGERTTRRGGGTAAARNRRLNKLSLRDLLVRLLDGTSMSTREAAEAALAAGYVTSSQNFANSVGVAMNGDKRFERNDEGKWCLADGVEIPADPDGERDDDDDDDSDD